MMYQKYTNTDTERVQCWADGRGGRIRTAGLPDLNRGALDDSDVWADGRGGRIRTAGLTVPNRAL